MTKQSTSLTETANGETVKIELPDNHPIAEAIRKATNEDWRGHLFLSLDHLTPNGTAVRLLSYRIDTYSKIKTVHFEFNGTDVDAERQYIESLGHWPVMPD